MVISDGKGAVASEACFSGAPQHNSKASNEASPEDSFPSILPGLSDDVAKICLARVPLKHIPVLGAVCKRWRSLIQSKEFSFVRKESGMLKEWLYFITKVSKKSRIELEVMSSGNEEVWRIPPMPSSVNNGFCKVVLDGKLLIIGGFSEEIGRSSASSDVHQYDPRLNRWSMLAKMKVVRNNFSCRKVNGMINAVGGDIPFTTEIYDPDKNEWTLMDEKPRPPSPISTRPSIFTDGLEWCKFRDWINELSMSIDEGNMMLGKKLYYLKLQDLVIFDRTDNSRRLVPLPCPIAWESNIRLGILCNKLFLFPTCYQPNFLTLIYDPAAPPGSEWCSSTLRAPPACLSTVTIEA